MTRMAADKFGQAAERRRDVAHDVAYTAVTFDSLIPRERLHGRFTT